MSVLAALLHSTLLSALGWTLVHFLWQGAAVGAIFALLRYYLRNKSPVARYNLAVVTLMLLAALPPLTFIHLLHTAAGAAGSAMLHGASVITATTAPSNPIAFMGLWSTAELWLRPLVSWTVPLWFVGVLLMSLRLGHGWRHTRYLRRTINIAPLPEWTRIVESLSAQLGIRKLVRLAVSLQVHVPSVIGWFKPIILLPPSVLSGLTPLQVELILAHELAHVRRHDYLWNWLQVVVETLLFYHPVVRWVSNQARIEREQCCDDMVVALHGNALEYARALTELEGLRHPHAALTLGANGGQVLERIHRLLGRSAVSMPVAWIPLLVGACLLLAGGLLSSGQVKAPWQIALTQQYSLTGQLQQRAVAPAPVQVSLLPTRIAPAPTDLPRPRPLPLSERPNRIFAMVPMAAPTTVETSQLPAPPVVEPKQQAPAPERQGGEILEQHAPAYPAFAQERGVEGDAKIVFTLTADAEITDVHVAKITGSRLFGEAAMNAIRRWKFTPVTLAGKPVAQQMTVDFAFRLHSATSADGSCKIPMGYHVCTN